MERRNPKEKKPVAPPLPIRLSDELVVRLSKAADKIKQNTGIAPSRSAVLRRAIIIGLEVVEKEMGTKWRPERPTK
jgi:predicted transcriptional regulator